MENYPSSYLNPGRNQAFRPRQERFVPQKDLNSPVDPLFVRQNNSAQLKKKKKIHKLEKTLSVEEGEQLLSTWRENNFSEFNSWIQVAKAQMSTEIFENSNEINKNAKRVFTCNLSLTFDEDPSFVMISNGFAKNKKDAKKTAIEKIVIELIQNGEISRGLKPKDLLTNGSKSTDNLNQKPQTIKELPDDNTQRKVHKLAKRMQEFLKKESFLEACEVLCQIVMKKKPEWNEIAFIWSFALLKKDLSFVKAIIDLIQFKRVQPTLNNSNSEENVNGSISNKDEREERAKRELLKKYGNCRMKTDNPYDVLDTFNMEVNLPEIEAGREISDEEANASIIRNPLAANMDELLTIDPVQGSLGNISDLRQPQAGNPADTFSDLKVLNIYNAVEANRILHESSLKRPNITEISLNRDQAKNTAFESRGLDDLLAQKSFSAQPQSLYNLENANNYRVEQGGLREEYFDSTPRIDLSTSREIKNPAINYLSYKLLNELYDSLLYIGDINFALSVSEVLYTRIKLNDEEFINNFACLYYANKKNMLVNELIESIFQPIMKSVSRKTDAGVSVNGLIEKIGNKYTQEVVVFTPCENSEQINGKILKKGFCEGREDYHQIAEGEFVLLSSDEPFDVNPSMHSILANNSDVFNRSLLMGQNQQGGQFNGNALTSSISTSKSEMIACIREIQKDYKIKLFILPSKEQSDALTHKNRVWKITKLSNRNTVDKTCESLETFATQITMAQPLLQIILSPPICNNNYVQQLAESKVFLQNRSHAKCVTNLNTSQQRALDSSTAHLLTLIQGPPGTGKTTTAVEVVLEWLRSSPAPILACADSNVAVDLLYSEFMQAGIKAMRIGPGYDDRHEFKMDKNYQQYITFYNSKQFHHSNSIRFGIIKRMINEAQVVCATCVGSTSEYLKGMNFPRVIMDEVTQANEMSTLIPLTKGCQQLVLIGDHKQLPPTVISTFSQSKGMTISLFERLVKQGIQPNLLNIQYRMHPSIAQFPSFKFYDNMLENGIDDSQRPIVPGFNWPNPAVRVAFVNVKGYEQVYASSIQNPREVEVVVEILMQLLSFDQDVSSIGIITPYDAQRRKLRSEVNIQAGKFPELFGLTSEQARMINRNTVLNDIDTVDGYQGMERDVIIFSAVRSNKSGTLGFLRDPRRLNVTLTRAKRGLIIVGDLTTLINDKNWSEWIAWCKQMRIIMQHK